MSNAKLNKYKMLMFLTYKYIGIKLIELILTSHEFNSHVASETVETTAIFLTYML